MNENPYNPLHPTTDPTLFFGRKNAFSFFQLHLAGAINEDALVVIGQRGIGKSSLLSQVPLHIDERYLPIWVDLSTLELDDPVGFVATIVDQTHAVMDAVDASTYRLPDFPDTSDPEIDLLRWLADDFLDIAMTAIRRERHLVIMLDETQLLFDVVGRGNFPADFFDYLSSLLHQHERLNIIAALDIRYEDKALQTPPFHNANLHYRLTHLAEDQARALIEQPVKDVYTFDAAALRKIMQLTGGHPFHIHSMCRLIFRLWQERSPERMGMSEVESIYPAALEQARDVVEGLWDYARPNERLALTALLDLRKHNEHPTFPLSAIKDWLSNTEFALNEVQLGAALRGLQYLGVVQTNEDGDYRFSSGIQGDWLLRYSNVAPSEQKSVGLLTRLPRREVSALIGTALIIVAVIGFSELGGDENNAEATPVDAPATSTLVPSNPTATLEPTRRPTEMPTPTPTPSFRFGG